MDFGGGILVSDDEDGSRRLMVFNHRRTGGGSLFGQVFQAVEGEWDVRFIWLRQPGVVGVIEMVEQHVDGEPRLAFRVLVDRQRHSAVLKHRSRFMGELMADENRAGVEIASAQSRAGGVIGGADIVEAECLRMALECRPQQLFGPV